MIIDLAVILCAAALSTLIFSKMRQPVVLGYLIAGFLVGPHFPLWPTVVDNDSVKMWAEIGVIFLLFGLGLEFSFKKLAKVGKSAFIAAIFEIITMSAVGYFFGRALGWTVMDSIYVGAILSMSSTTIIIRAFDEAGLKGRAFASLVFGILIVEDLMAIVLMVILSALSVPGSFSGTNLAFLSGRLLFFFFIWFLAGIYILPTLLRRVSNILSN
jgi:monovalent cation:H+ antiporter-2, CPA2 family